MNHKDSDDINTGLSLMSDIVLGDLNSEDYPHLSLNITGRDVPFTPNLLLEINLSVRDRHYKYAETLNKVYVPDGNSEMFHFLCKHLYDMARKMSFQLFEVDPRIGMHLQGDFPNSPLFDPPYITDTYKNALLGPYPSHSMRVDLLRCQICNHSLCVYPEGVNIDVVWGGGNLGFVHVWCAPWINTNPE